MSSLDGNGPCDDCGTHDNIIWFTDNELWNQVMSDDPAPLDDPGGILCILCFVKRVEAKGYHANAWRVIPWVAPPWD